MEVVEQFNYLGRSMYQNYDDWLAVRRNIKWTWRV